MPPAARANSKSPGRTPVPTSTPKSGSPSGTTASPPTTSILWRCLPACPLLISLSPKSILRLYQRSRRHCDKGRYLKYGQYYGQLKRAIEHISLDDGVSRVHTGSEVNGFCKYGQRFIYGPGNTAFRRYHQPVHICSDGPWSVVICRRDITGYWGCILTRTRRKPDRRRIQAEHRIGWMRRQRHNRPIQSYRLGRPFGGPWIYRLSGRRQRVGGCCFNCQRTFRRFGTG
jgi:hypothetical protein